MYDRCKEAVNRKKNANLYQTKKNESLSTTNQGNIN